MPYRHLHGEGVVERPDEVVVVGLAVRARDHVTVLAVVGQTARNVHHGPATVLACQPLLAARHGRKNIVRVHGAQEKCAAVPLALACCTAYVVAAFKAGHADSVDVL